MSEKKNIERLFQEKFKDFEAVPSPHIWDNIEAELHKKKKRRVIPIWFRLSGVAALLLIALFVGNAVWNNSPDNNPNNGIVHQENGIQNDIQNNNENDNGRNLSPTKNPIRSNDVVTDASNASDNVNSNSVSSEENNRNANEVSGNQKASENANAIIPKNASSSKNAVANSSKKSIIRKNKSATVSTKTAIASAETNNKAKRNQKKTAISDDVNLGKNNSLANQENLKSNENSGKANSLDLKNNTQNPNAITENNNSNSTNGNNKTQIAFDKTAVLETKKDSTAVATVVPNPLEELLLQQEKEKQAVTETKVNRWQITSNVAPIYFSSASNGSPISQEFADNGKDYERNMSYGVGVNYALSNKWSVRGGVNKLTLGYNTHDIVYYAGLEDQGRAANSFAAKGSAIIIEDNTAANIVSFDNVPGKKAGHLNQTMGYVEVPVELSYKILDKKFGIELIGGMSTMFLNENNLSVVSDGMSATVGKADNLNDVSFTSNIGLGFKYIFWKSFQANIEPKFKYQLNAFSENDGGFKPYFIGIYTGLSFSF